MDSSALADRPAPADGAVAAAIGLDVGGGAIKAGAVLLDARGRLRPVLDELRVSHRADADGPALSAVCARTTRELHGRLRSAWPALSVAWGVSAAAWIDPRSGAAVFSPHLPGWRDRPLPEDLAAALSHLTGIPAAGHLPAPSVINDADAAAWAQARLGPSGHRAAADRMVFVAIGTGIGGALVRHGVVDVGAHGMAGEYGHMSVDPSGAPCPCGNTGCWELAVSARALAARAGRSSARAALDDALAGAPEAVRAVRQTGRWLGRGLATLATVLDPSRFVVGGGLAVAGDLLLEPARAELALHLPGAAHRPAPPVTVATLGNRAGWLGAAGVALERAGWSVTGPATAVD